MMVGCCGTAGRSLEEYAKSFKALEVQSTFYKLPKVETAERWRNAVPEDFKFTMKAFQGITHPANSPTWKRYRKLIQEAEQEEVGMLSNSKFVSQCWRETLRIASALRAEVIVVQLPPSFKFSKENVMRIMELPFDKSRLALEFRDESWYRRIGQVRQAIAGKNAIIVWDPLKFGDLQQEEEYFRLHGMNGFTNYRYVYTIEEIRKLSSVCEKKSGYVFFNNFKMWENALMLKEAMGQQ